MRTANLLTALCLFCVPTLLLGNANAQPPDTRSPKTILLTGKLFTAIFNGDDSAVKAALKNGSDPNGRNWLGFTPLMWASVRGQQSETEYLLAHGARLNEPSPYGTALSLSLNGRHEKLALYLISKGANTHPARVDGCTPMMYAAANDFTELIRVLVHHNESPDVKDVAGDTALMYAARCGRMAATKELLSLGASVNLADMRGTTPLMEAVSNGHAAVVKALLEAHASVDAKDRAGNTALLLAGRYCSEPGIIDALLKKGANPKTRDSKGNSALSLAMARGHADCAATLRHAASGVADAGNPGRVTDAHTAIDASLSALQTGMKKFADLARCNSCHHQGLGLTTLGLAADNGFKVDGKLIGAYMQNLGEDGKGGAPLIHQALANPELVCTVPAVDIGDMPIGAGYMFGALMANHVPANPGLAEAAQLVAGLQKPDGRWIYGIDREPMQGSQITTTALVINVLKTYGSQDPAAHIADRIERAKSWLLKASPADSEGKASRLLGLKWAGASDDEVAQAVKDVRSAQHADGGWSQLPGMGSDAYATGISLYALSVGGSIASADADMVRGVGYLINTQDEDGTWYVYKRTMPANNYFDAAFPHGESQYASFAGTCWATMALLKTMPPHETAGR